MQKKSSKRLSYFELLQLEKNIISVIINNTTILLEAQNLNKNIVGKYDINYKEFKRKDIPYKLNQKNLHRFTKKYKVNNKDFVNKIKSKAVRSFYINSILSNNLLTPGLRQVISQYDLQIREIEVMSIPFSMLKTPKYNLQELKMAYDNNIIKFYLAEIRTLNYFIISSNLFKKNIKNIFNDLILELHKSKKYFFILPEKKYIIVTPLYSLQKTNIIKQRIKKNIHCNLSKELNLRFKSFFFNDISNKPFYVKNKYFSRIKENPFGLYIFKLQKILFLKTREVKYVKSSLKEEYLKQLFFKKFVNQIKVVKKRFKAGEDVTTLSKILNVDIKSIVLAKYSKKTRYKNIIRTRLFLRTAFNTKLNYKSKLFPVSFNKFCLIQIVKVTKMKTEKANNVVKVLKAIWIMKIIKFKIKNDIFISLSKIKNVTVKISNRKDLPVFLYQRIFQIRDQRFAPPIINYHRKVLLLIKLKKVVYPIDHDVKKYKRIYQTQIKFIEQQIVMYDLLLCGQKRQKISVNPVIKNYMSK